MTVKRKAISGHQVADLSVLIALAALVCWYFLDARKASESILNLILVLPLTGITLLLCLVQFCRQLVSPSEEGGAKDPIRSVLPVIGLFAVFTLTLPWLGFDGGTFLFIGAFLRIHGERRWTWIVGYSLAFASLASLFFAAMLPYPLPMLLLPE